MFEESFENTKIQILYDREEEKISVGAAKNVFTDLELMVIRKFENMFNCKKIKFLYKIGDKVTFEAVPGTLTDFELIVISSAFNGDEEE